MNKSLGRNKDMIFYIMILSLVTSFSHFIIGDGINVLLVICLIISLLYNVIKVDFDKKNYIAYLLMIGLFVSGILHLDSFRIGSWCYSVLFIMYFISIVSLLKKKILSINSYIKILRFVIVIYFICLIIQQLMYLSGFNYVFNQINMSASNGKFNSLATEPSYAARYLVIVFMSFIKMKELLNKRKYNIDDFKSDSIIWLFFIYQIITMNSSFGYMLFLLFFLRFINKKNLILIGITISAFIIVSVYFKNIAFQRLYDVSNAFLTFDDEEILKADHSAAMRIVPTLVYVREFSIISIDYWLGFGSDYSRNYIPTLVSGIREGRFLGGFLPVFLFNNGIINLILMFILIRKAVIIKLLTIDTFILFLCIAAAPFNSQLFWGIIILYSINKYFIVTLFRKNLNYA